jgi:putative SOS response-associated peptidase YedK
MCGRFTSLLSPELLTAIYGVLVPPSLLLEPRYNIAPSQPVLVVRQDISGHRELAPIGWGLIPSWAKDPSLGHSLINARAETVAEKPSFRSAYRHRRCIIPASGFYEWLPVGESKQPWYIKGSEDQPLSLAGLWEHWKSPDGSVIETCTIITTNANELMAPLHDRMPVIFPLESIAAWLEPNARQDEVTNLLRPCASELLAAYPVSNLVNNPRFDSPACVARV